ncbi:hypothetical protein PG996_004164 [Apiospora saccharicola]|uniref:Uncharacterized protein n=1 Tax=Apiospora saccharicola TaxID=335842 RepID=A0ABR1W3C7_9PEZI
MVRTKGQDQNSRHLGADQNSRQYRAVNNAFERKEPISVVFVCDRLKEPELPSQEDQNSRQYRAAENAPERKVLVSVVFGSRNPSYPVKPPQPFCLLGFFMVWAEKTIAVDGSLVSEYGARGLVSEYMARLEKAVVDARIAMGAGPVGGFDCAFLLERHDEPGYPSAPTGDLDSSLPTAMPTNVPAGWETKRRRVQVTSGHANESRDALTQEPIPSSCVSPGSALRAWLPINALPPNGHAFPRNGNAVPPNGGGHTRQSGSSAVPTPPEHDDDPTLAQAQIDEPWHERAAVGS